MESKVVNHPNRRRKLKAEVAIGAIRAVLVKSGADGVTLGELMRLTGSLRPEPVGDWHADLITRIAGALLMVGDVEIGDRKSGTLPIPDIGW
jgi:hypothetical protein